MKFIALSGDKKGENKGTRVVQSIPNQQHLSLSSQKTDQ